MIKVVNKHTHTPTSEDYYIGRGSALGNPFTSIKDRKTKAQYICESKEESVKAYRRYLHRKIDEKDPDVCKALNEVYKRAKNGDINLVCFCAPQVCHGFVIKEVVESKLKPKSDVGI